ncbi:MAG: transglutaminase-like domain-containing protein [Calditrichota bacterium]
MKIFSLSALILFFSTLLFSQEIVLSGRQESTIQYKLEQTIEPFAGIEELQASFVVPQDFLSPTYVQRVDNLKFKFSLEPDKREIKTDNRGNLVHEYVWNSPGRVINCQIFLRAKNEVNLTELKSDVPFPVPAIPDEVSVFLKGTDMVPAGDVSIRERASQLTEGFSSEMEAVQTILHFVVDHMRYVLIPDKFDALYALQTGKGNCQNYSHLAAALMRAAGVPVRIVNGVSTETSEYSFEMSQGRHSWIEVYFPDLGWIPFDPQQTQFFVSNRYLRIEVGLDNNETIQDGLVRWTQAVGAERQLPKLEEAIESDFISDDVSFQFIQKLTTPSKLLLSPVLAFAPAGEIPVKVEEPEEIPTELEESEEIPGEVEVPEKEVEEQLPVDYTRLNYQKPIEIGNLDFPRDFDFVLSRFQDQEIPGDQNELRRNFIVETAEYVTGGQVFAQTFELDRPIQLNKIGLALHSFGGSGDIWLEISDDKDGYPLPAVAASRKISAPRIRIPRGYDWVNFDFSDQKLILSPGRYWFVLRFRGFPIVNWFYSYGKSVGPSDGTRSRSVDGNKWDTIHSFEFNYRVVGLAAE